MSRGKDFFSLLKAENLCKGVGTEVEQQYVRETLWIFCPVVRIPEQIPGEGM